MKKIYILLKNKLLTNYKPQSELSNKHTLFSLMK